MKLSGNTSVHELLATYPQIEPFLISRSPKFEMLKNSVARATIGRVATLRTAADIAKLDLTTLLNELAAEIALVSGAKPTIENGSGTVETRAQRVAELAQIISFLHAGGDLEEARQRFNDTFGGVESSEIAAMEEELIRGGLPVSEVQRLCDVHVQAFRAALDQNPDVEVPPGHPVHTYIADNKVITNLAAKLGDIAAHARTASDMSSVLVSAQEVLRQLAHIENHYVRKENQLFPFLEKHDITGPTKVMWGVHDEIRAAYKTVCTAVQRGDALAFAESAPPLAKALTEMIYKEEKILFPLALGALTTSEWAAARAGEAAIGYGFTQPVAVWPAADAATPVPVATGLLELLTGQLSLEQLNLMLTHLPVDLSFVDENDTVRYYSEGSERIFPRSPGVIGRKVQNCHPPKSMDAVQRILDAFRAGTQSTADFWIELRGKFIYIRYFALRDKAGHYRGCLEVSQDATQIRQLQGERRLMSW